MNLLPLVADDDLAGEGFRKGRASRALIVVGDRDCRVQALDTAPGETGGPSTLLDTLADGGRHRSGGGGPTSRMSPLGSTIPSRIVALEASTLLPGRAPHVEACIDHERTPRSPAKRLE